MCLFLIWKNGKGTDLEYYICYPKYDFMGRWCNMEIFCEDWKTSIKEMIVVRSLIWQICHSKFWSSNGKPKRRKLKIKQLHKSWDVKGSVVHRSVSIWVIVIHLGLKIGQRSIWLERKLWWEVNGNFIFFYVFS